MIDDEEQKVNEQGVLGLDNNSLEDAEGCDIDSLVQDLMNRETVVMKLFCFLRALKSKIDFSKELTHEQYEILNHGLSCSDEKIVDISNECLELLFLNRDITIKESFLRLILPIIKDDIYLKLITRVLSDNHQKYLSLLNNAIGRLEFILSKDDLLQQESLNVINRVVQQRIKLPEKIIDFVEKCLDNKDLQVIAFKILKDQVDQGKYRVTEKYLDVYKNLVVKFKILDIHKESEYSKVNDGDLSILTSLLEIQHINNEVLSKSSSYKYLVRELLIYDLVKRTGAIDPVNGETFNRNWVQLETRHNYGLVSKDRDNILLQLIKLQEGTNYSLGHINQILELLIDLPEDTLINLDKKKDIIRDLKLIWLKYKFFLI